EAAASWRIVAPQFGSRCASCCKQVHAGEPRIDVGTRTRQNKPCCHHVGCLAPRCGPLQLLRGWDALAAGARSEALSLADPTAKAALSELGRKRPIGWSPDPPAELVEPGYGPEPSSPSRGGARRRSPRRGRRRAAAARAGGGRGAAEKG
ncbi:unnamed protein product, partial [Prorocentrum cordatum]